MTTDAPTERLREALQAAAEQADSSPDAYARLADRLSTERFPPRQWTAPGTAAFPATSSTALGTVAGPAALANSAGEGGIVLPSSPPPFHRSAEDHVAGPTTERRLPATATAGPSVYPPNEPMDGYTELGNPVGTAAAHPDRVARATDDGDSRPGSDNDG